MVSPQAPSCVGPRGRRLAKRLLRPLLPDRLYGPLHSLAKALDIRTGRWSEPEIALLAHLLRPGETAIDAGANHGLYTFHLSRAVGPTGRVHAFEPVPFTYDGLRRVSRLLALRNVQLVRSALGESPGEAEIVLPLQPSGALNTGLAHLAGHGDLARARRVGCRVLTLDAFPLAGEVSLVKCDIEGAELLAMRGAERVLERDAPSLLLEVDPTLMGRYGLAPRDLSEHLAAHGYSPYRLRVHPGGRRLEPVPRLEVGNHLFLHPRRRARVDDLIAGVEGRLGV